MRNIINAFVTATPTKKFMMYLYNFLFKIGTVIATKVVTSINSTHVLVVGSNCSRAGDANSAAIFLSSKDCAVLHRVEPVYMTEMSIHADAQILSACTMSISPLKE